MSETIKRTPPPPLEFRTPPCSICGEDTDYEDGFVCNECGAYWDADNAHLNKGEWHDPDATQCTSVLTPWPNDTNPALREVRYRCILADDHEPDKHRHPEWYDTWADKKAVVTVVPVGGVL